MKMTIETHCIRLLFLIAFIAIAVENGVSWMWAILMGAALCIIEFLWFTEERIPVKIQPTMIPVDTAGVDFDRLLNDFGTREDGEIPAQHLPLNPDFLRVAKAYSKIVFENERVFDRAFMAEPYPDNPEYVQIGLLCEQDPILLKRNSEDPKVYLVYIDECSPDAPDECIASFQEYVIGEYKTTSVHI